MSEGILLSSTNGEMWDLFKAIIQKAEAKDSHAEIAKIAERGIEFLKGEAL